MGKRYNGQRSGAEFIRGSSAHLPVLCSYSHTCSQRAESILQSIWLTSSVQKATVQILPSRICLSICISKRFKYKDKNWKSSNLQAPQLMKTSWAGRVQILRERGSQEGKDLGRGPHPHPHFLLSLKGGWTPAHTSHHTHMPETAIHVWLRRAPSMYD